MGAVEGKGARGVGARIPAPIIRKPGISAFLIGGVISVGEFVVPALGEPAERDLEARPASESLAPLVSARGLVEKAGVAQLVGGDAAADFLQHRLRRRLAQRGVVGAGAGLDDAARDHLAGTRATARAGAVEIAPIALAEPGEGRIELETRIGQRR